MEAFKTRRSFLNGQLGFDTASNPDMSDDSEDGTGDEIAWLQASVTDLSDLCVADMSNTSPLLQQFCESLAQQQGLHAAAQQPPPQSQPLAASATSGNDTDEEDDPF